MTSNISQLNWQQASGDARAALITLIAANDVQYNVALNGTDSVGNSVSANFAVIDNLANNGIVNLTYGPFSYNVAPYTRKTFPILVEQPFITFNITIGTINVTLANFDPKIPDDVNQVATSAAGAVTVYSVLDLAGASPIQQQISHANKHLLFDFGGNGTYNLLPCSVAGNGYFNPSIYYKYQALGNFTIKPNAGDILYMGNLIRTNAAPLILTAGQSIMLTTDGASTWYARQYQN